MPPLRQRQFYVIIDQRNTTSFRLGLNRLGERDALEIDREYSGHTEYQRVYCWGCGMAAFKRRDLEDAGWPIPI